MISILIFLGVLSVLIFFHELGHFLAAKACGIYVDRFSIGMPPRVAGIKLGETDYCIGALPIGGFVKMAGQEDSPLDDEEREKQYGHVPPERWFNNRPVWQRFIVVLAGPLMNVVLAVVLYSILAAMGYMVSEPELEARVGKIEPEYPAATAPLYEEIPGAPFSQYTGDADAVGWKTGDVVLAVNGEPIENYMDLAISAILGGENAKHWALIERSSDDGTSKRYISPVTPVLKEGDENPRYGVGAFTSAYIGEVMEDMPAAAAGLQAEDIIVAAEGQRVSSDTFVALTETAPEGVPLQLEVERAGKRFDVAITPATVGRITGLNLGPADDVKEEDIEAATPEVRFVSEEAEDWGFKRRDVISEINGAPVTLGYAKARQEQTESPAKLARDETVAKLLGLIPAGMNYQAEMLKMLEDQVGGFYDPGTNTFFLMDTFTGGVAKVIMAHELTHALDDQHFDIDGTLAKCGEDTDATLAFQAVVEGSGTGLMNQWFLKHRGDVTPADLEAAQGLGADVLANAPPYMWKPLLAAYLSGDAFLVHTSGMNMKMKAATTPDIQQTFATPPRSSEQILHPKKYWDADKRDDPLQVSIDVSKVPADWKVAGVDTLGELYLALITTPIAKRKGLDLNNPASVLGVEYTNKSAEGWGGDRLVLLRRGDDAMLQLVTAWDSEADADEFAAALGESRKPTSIPVFAGSERSPEKGWVAGSTATDAIVTRERGADGKTSIVVVRVFSFAGAAPSEGELVKLELPFSVAAKAAK